MTISGTFKYIQNLKFPKFIYRRVFKKFFRNPFLSFAPPGHFYSPIPDLSFIDKHKEILFNKNITQIPAINLYEKEQCHLIQLFSTYYDEFPFKENKTDNFRFYLNNSYFSYGDALALYSIIRHFGPNNILEVGSGFSSAMLLDINDRFFNGQIKLRFIEPYPDRLYSLLNETDEMCSDIIIDTVQNFPPDNFIDLKENDILFIDSSHVAKIGSDIVYILNYVLPNLNKGVIIHFHDIFWPFEYPEEWLYQGRAWNESYFLRAFLQFNDNFNIIFFNSYLGIHHFEELKRYLPIFTNNIGGSLWLKKVR